MVVAWQAIGNDEPMDIPVNGYLAVYLSNASSIKCEGCMNSEGDVYFDKVKIKFTRGNLKQETHYYPFGLPMAGIGSSAAGMTPNRQKYQSNEYITDAGLNWMSFGARQYDPQLGRFLSVDPLAAVGGQDMLSPYQAMGNNPVSSMDPGGTAYYSMENYVDNRGNRFYLSPGTIASLGLPWTGDPTGFTPPPSWDYGAFFDASCNAAMIEFTKFEISTSLKRIIRDREDDNKIAEKYGLNSVTLMLNLTVPLDNKWYYHNPDDKGNGGDENPEKAGKFGTYTVWDRAGGYDKKLSKEEADLWYLWGGGEAIYVNNAYINWNGLTIPKGLKRGDIFAIGTAEAFMKLPYETAATYGGTSFEVIDNNTVKVLDQEYHYRYRDNNSISNIVRNFMTWWGAPSYVPQGQPYMIHYYNREIKIK